MEDSPMNDSLLARKLIIIVLIKIIVIFSLWWAFIRDQRVTIDTGTMANVIAPVSQSAPVQHQTSQTGGKHDQ